MIAGAQLSSLMILMIDKPIVCWEVKKYMFAQKVDGNMLMKLTPAINFINI
jgi:hypothetical protein